MVSITGTPLSGFEVLLDNQIHEGRVGYDVLLPLKMNQAAPIVWVNMGWLAAPLYRHERPKLPKWPAQLTVQGIVTKPGQMVTLSKTLLETDKRPYRIQTIDFNLLETVLMLPQTNFLVHSHANKVQYGLIETYRPTNMPPGKHYAYAMQWWGLSLVWLLGVVILWRKTLKQDKNNRG